MPQDGAHLAAREIQHPAPLGVLDERTGGPLGHERRERPAVPHEVTSRPLEISDIGHRPIIAAGTIGVRATAKVAVCAEQRLHGGITNVGQVVRVGSHVLRPSSPHSGSIHAFLRAVRHAGFEGAPVPVGIDEDGRERLVFIDGEVPVPPYPDWSQSDTALASIARLLRGLHDAARGFDAVRSHLGRQSG